MRKLGVNFIKGIRAGPARTAFIYLFICSFIYFLTRLFISFLFFIISSLVHYCGPVMRMRLKGKPRQMDGPGHTAIFFRLDSLIRSLAAPCARTNCFTFNCGRMRDDLPWRGCWRKAGYVQTGGERWSIHWLGFSVLYTAHLPSNMRGSPSPCKQYRNLLTLMGQITNALKTH